MFVGARMRRTTITSMPAPCAFCSSNQTVLPGRSQDREGKTEESPPPRVTVHGGAKYWPFTIFASERICYTTDDRDEPVSMMEKLNPLRAYSSHWNRTLRPICVSHAGWQKYLARHLVLYVVSSATWTRNDSVKLEVSSHLGAHKRAIPTQAAVSSARPSERARSTTRALS
jgi:hypothetical protein